MALEARDIDDVDLASLYRDHGPRLRRLIRRRVPHHLVDDTLHDTFVRVHASWSRLDLDLPVFPFLATLAHRACHETLRREEQHAKRVAAALLTTVVSEPHETLEHVQRAEMLAAAWLALEPRQRRLVYRRHVVGDPYARMADDEGVTVEALRAAVHRARRTFGNRYRNLAETTGVFAAFGMPSTRLRSRLQRVGAWLRDVAQLAVELPIAAMACAAVVTFAVVSVATGARPSMSRTEAVSSSEMSLAFASEAGISAPLATTVGVAFRDTPTERDSRTPAGDRPTLVRAKADPDVDLGPEGAEVLLTIVIEQPISQSEHRTEMPVYCNRGMVSTALCTVVRSAPDQKEPPPTGPVHRS